MQIYAIDSLDQIIHVARACRGKVYTCPECQKPIRLRGGRFRQLHFFHLEPTPCRLHSKSQTHLHIQHALQKMLAPERVLIEHRFPQIGRIADIVWPAQKLIFEVQISPISADEIRARNSDYRKAGYQVIWILHKGRFNRTRVTPAELALRGSPHYFTNINAFGKGFFYDQHATIYLKRRIKRSIPLPISFKRVFPVNMKQLPRQFPEERKKWGISFEGDLFHHPQLCNTSPRASSSWRHILLTPYRIVLHYLLEKTTL